ncbi:chemotaxis protein CheC [Miltoncostaea marina]|uniref:chemotaxis protein CheC n=1 Tax=Miltoncostaea marina TaxID=2843215 RepID=UPI001C3E146E|nr:chemotaxis protein CheC [Miltoncostaea marina]
MSAALGEAQLDALRELGTIGAGTAATALSSMTGATVRMAVPRVSLLPVEELAERVAGDGDRLVAAVLLRVTGDAPGHMLFVIEHAAAHRVVRLLAGGAEGAAAADGPGGFGAMGLSVLQEVGNILTGSYLGALSALTGLRLEPTPPAVGVDMAGALVGAVLAEVALAADGALLVESELGAPGGAVDGEVIFIPTAAALATVLGRLGVGD